MRRFFRMPMIPAAALGAAVLLPYGAGAQGGAPKPRLELADSARGNRNPATVAAAPSASAPVAGPRLAPAGATAAQRVDVPGSTSTGPRADFARNQTVLGIAIYAPAFATTIATRPAAWAASYIVMAGASYVGAAEISRQMVITDPMQDLTTWMPVNGAIAGGLLGVALKADQPGNAGAVFAGALGGTAISLWRGRSMNTGEATATIAGSDVGGLTLYGLATAAGLVNDTSVNRTRLGMTAAGMLLGAPLGHAYASLAPYHVTRGDIAAMTATATVGMLAGLTVIADTRQPSERQLAGALTYGGLAGFVVGDLLLTRRYDHTDEQGTAMIGGGIVGGLMGAGVALLTGQTRRRWSTAGAAFTTLGAAVGVAWSQYYVRPAADGGMQLGSLRFNPAGILGAAARAPGAHTLATITF